MELREGMDVRVLHTDYPEIPAGTITHIVRVSGANADLWCKEFPEGLYFFRKEFEPVAVADSNGNERGNQPRFKVGDRVRVIRSGEGKEGSSHEADIGTVTEIISIEKFDDRVEYLTSSDWFFYAHEIELVGAPLTIREGRYYRTRDGRKVGPMRLDVGDFWEAPDIDDTYYDNGRQWEAYETPHDIIAEWADESATAVASSNDYAYGISHATADFTVPLDAPEFGGTESKFKVGDRVHYKDAYCEGNGVIHSDNDAAKGLGWFVTVEEKDRDHAPFDDNTTRIFTEDKLRLVAEATSGKDTINRIPWMQQADNNVATIADIVRRLEALEAAAEPEWIRHAKSGERDLAAAALFRLTGMRHSDARYVVDRYAA